MKEDRTGGASGAKTYRMEAREARGWAVPRLIPRALIIDRLSPNLGFRLT
jgi:hypothetical protein